jgi:hypothetical protein
MFVGSVIYEKMINKCDMNNSQGWSQKILWEGASQKKNWFFRIFLLKKFYFCYFLNRRLPINKKSEHLKVWAINKNKNLMGIAQKN